MRIGACGFAVLSVISGALACKPALAPQLSPRDECEAAFDRAQGVFDTEVPKSSFLCSNDIDCSAIRSSCRDGCGGKAISVRDVPRYEEATRAAAADCVTYAAPACVTASPRKVSACVPTHPRCVQGRCRMSE